jgi:hypothetical protein
MLADIFLLSSLWLALAERAFALCFSVRDGGHTNKLSGFWMWQTPCMGWLCTIIAFVGIPLTEFLAFFLFGPLIADSMAESNEKWEIVTTSTETDTGEPYQMTFNSIEASSTSNATQAGRALAHLLRGIWCCVYVISAGPVALAIRRRRAEIKERLRRAVSNSMASSSPMFRTISYMVNLVALPLCVLLVAIVALLQGSLVFGPRIINVRTLASLASIWHALVLALHTLIIISMTIAFRAIYGPKWTPAPFLASTLDGYTDGHTATNMHRSHADDFSMDIQGSAYSWNTPSFPYDMTSTTSGTHHHNRLASHHSIPGDASAARLCRRSHSNGALSTVSSAIQRVSQLLHRSQSAPTHLPSNHNAANSRTNAMRSGRMPNDQEHMDTSSMQPSSSPASTSTSPPRSPRRLSIVRSLRRLRTGSKGQAMCSNETLRTNDHMPSEVHSPALLTERLSEESYRDDALQDAHTPYKQPWQESDNADITYPYQLHTGYETADHSTKTVLFKTSHEEADTTLKHPSPRVKSDTYTMHYSRNKSASHFDNSQTAHNRSTVDNRLNLTDEPYTLVSTMMTDELTQLNGYNDFSTSEQPALNSTTSTRPSVSTDHTLVHAEDRSTHGRRSSASSTPLYRRRSSNQVTTPVYSSYGGWRAATSTPTTPSFPPQQQPSYPSEHGPTKQTGQADAEEFKSHQEVAHPTDKSSSVDGFASSLLERFRSSTSTSSPSKTRIDAHPETYQTSSSPSSGSLLSNTSMLLRKLPGLSTRGQTQPIHSSSLAIDADSDHDHDRSMLDNYDTASIPGTRSYTLSDTLHAPKSPATSEHDTQLSVGSDDSSTSQPFSFVLPPRRPISRGNSLSAKRRPAHLTINASVSHQLPDSNVQHGATMDATSDSLPAYSSTTSSPTPSRPLPNHTPKQGDATMLPDPASPRLTSQTILSKSRIKPGNFGGLDLGPFGSGGVAECLEEDEEGSHVSHNTQSTVSDS